MHGSEARDEKDQAEEAAAEAATAEEEEEEEEEAGFNSLWKCFSHFLDLEVGPVEIIFVLWCAMRGNNRDHRRPYRQYRLVNLL